MAVISRGRCECFLSWSKWKTAALGNLFLSCSAQSVPEPRKVPPRITSTAR